MLNLDFAYPLREDHSSKMQQSIILLAFSILTSAALSCDVNLISTLLLDLSILRPHFIVENAGFSKHLLRSKTLTQTTIKVSLISTTNESKIKTLQDENLIFCCNENTHSEIENQLSKKVSSPRENKWLVLLQSSKNISSKFNISIDEEVLFYDCGTNVLSEAYQYESEIYSSLVSRYSNEGNVSKFDRDEGMLARRSNFHKKKFTLATSYQDPFVMFDLSMRPSLPNITGKYGDAYNLGRLTNHQQFTFLDNEQTLTL